MGEPGEGQQGGEGPGKGRRGEVPGEGRRGGATGASL